jgi:lipopolysaccharide transport system ATP-binding protein
MKDVTGREGRTVLFVSHNMGAVAQLTTRAVVLSQSRLDFIGSSQDAIAHYLHRELENRSIEYDCSLAKRPWEGTGEARIMTLRFHRPAPVFRFGEPLQFILRVRATTAIPRIRVSIGIYASDGAIIGAAIGSELDGMGAGEQREFSVTLPLRLVAGSYFCTISVGRGTHHTSLVEYDVIAETLSFEVTPEQTESGAIAKWYSGWGRIAFEGLSASPV